jgi:hypothetical protein
LNSLLRIGDLRQRTMQSQPLQVCLNSQSSAGGVGVASGQLLSASPQVAALRWAGHACLAQRMDITKVAWGTSLNQSDHLAGHKIGKAVQENSSPGCCRGGQQLGRAAGNLEAKDD